MEFRNFRPSTILHQEPILSMYSICRTWLVIVSICTWYKGCTEWVPIYASLCVYRFRFWIIISKLKFLILTFRIWICNTKLCFDPVRYFTPHKWSASGGNRLYGYRSQTLVQHFLRLMLLSEKLGSLQSVLPIHMVATRILKPVSKHAFPHTHDPLSHSLLYMVKVAHLVTKVDENPAEIFTSCRGHPSRCLDSCLYWHTCLSWCSCLCWYSCLDPEKTHRALKGSYWRRRLLPKTLFPSRRNLEWVIASEKISSSLLQATIFFWLPKNGRLIYLAREDSLTMSLTKIYPRMGFVIILVNT